MGHFRLEGIDRMSILENMPHRATAVRRVRTTDSLGGNKDSFETVFSDRSCWRQQASDSEITEFAKRGINITNKVFFTENPQLNETHSLVVDGERYDVISGPVPDASAGMGVIWRVMVNWKSTRR